MKQQSKNWKLRLFNLSLSFSLIILFCFVGQFELLAQSNLTFDNYIHKISANGTYQDFKVPSSGYQYVYLEARGADGGDRSTTWYDRQGGDGANIGASFTIGTATNQLAPGGIIRFVVGKGGSNAGSDGIVGAGGGGGTGILYLPPGLSANIANNWKLLIVAGGGGGATGDCCTVKYSGDQARVDSPGSGKSASGHIGDGGGIYGPSDNSKNPENRGKPGFNPLPTGGAGGHSPDQFGTDDGTGRNQGGFGFGGGGAGGGGVAAYAGGGGGYSGGSAGYVAVSGDAGEGGTSYINTQFAISSSIFKLQNGSSDDPNDGFAFYKASNSSNPVKATSIALSQHSTKCLDLDDGNTNNGQATIQIFDCQKRNMHQLWVLDGDMIRLKDNLDKCLDLSAGNTSNGAKVQLWDCQFGNTNQKWSLDINTKQIRFKANTNKCLDLESGNTGNSTKIHLWDCLNNSTQAWFLPQKIIRRSTPNKCIDLDDGNTSNGEARIQIWDCQEVNTHQAWIFDGDKIRSVINQNKCLDLSDGNTNNGGKIQLWDCTDNANKRWIYDSYTGLIHLKANTSKCLDLAGGDTGNGTKIQLWDCNSGNNNQIWMIR